MSARDRPQAHDRQQEGEESPAATVDDDRVLSRAGRLTGAERRVGSDDPVAQARAILLESEERILEYEQAPREGGERRTSDEATAPRPVAIQKPDEG